jgi:hypothetical protein
MRSVYVENKIRRLKYKCEGTNSIGKTVSTNSEKVKE